jgi:glutamyl-tRNA synthetase
MAANSLFFFRPPDSYDEKAVRKHVNGEITSLLATALAELKALEHWTAPAIHALVSDLAARNSLPLGKLAQPLRLAVCGGTVSPPIDATLAILGREQTLARLGNAVAAWSR